MLLIQSTYHWEVFYNRHIGVSVLVFEIGEKLSWEICVIQFKYTDSLTNVGQPVPHHSVVWAIQYWSTRADTWTFVCYDQQPF